MLACGAVRPLRFALDLTRQVVAIGTGLFYNGEVSAIWQSKGVGCPEILSPLMGPESPHALKRATKSGSFFSTPPFKFMQSGPARIFLSIHHEYGIKKMPCCVRDAAQPVLSQRICTKNGNQYPFCDAIGNLAKADQRSRFPPARAGSKLRCTRHGGALLCNKEAVQNRSVWTASLVF